MFQRLNITARLLVAFIIPLTICLLLTAVIVTNQTAARVLELNEASASQSALIGSELVSRWIDSRMAIVRSLAQTDTLASGEPERIMTLLEHFMGTNDAFEVMFYADLAGKAYYHHRDVRDRSDRDYFQKIVVRKSAEQLVSAPTHSGTTGNPITLLVHVVKDARGQVVGMLAATVTLNALSELVSSLAGGNSIAWLLDPGGIYVAHPDEARLLKANAVDSPLPEYAEMSRHMIAGEKGTADLLLDGEARYFVAYHGVENTPGWSLAVATPHDEVVSPANAMRQRLLLAFVVALTVLVGVVVMVARVIVRPVNETCAALDRIAEGDGNLTLRLSEHRQDEFGQLAHSFNAFVGGVQGMVGKVSEVATRLGTSAERLAASSGATNGQVHSQQHEANQVSAAMTEMVATIAEVATNADHAATAAGDSSRAVRECEEVVRNTVQEVTALSDGLQTAVGVMHRLQQNADAIGAVVEVIRGIAAQTNLLALNAAIEAARAGEHGRGFAVVADEVRSLSTRTQTSTEEIRAIIETLQGTASDAACVMDAGYARAQGVVGWIGRAEEKLGDITRGVGTINAMNAQIAHATEAQSSVAEEIGTTLARISSGIDGLSESSDQVAASSEELANLAVNLEARIGHFKV